MDQYEKTHTTKSLSAAPIHQEVRAKKQKKKQSHQRHHVQPVSARIFIVDARSNTTWLQHQHGDNAFNKIVTQVLSY